MRFAYLIIAHNEFEILRLLVSKLDDSKNDIYIHFDKKVRTLPGIHTQYSKLYILDKRVDVRWGHVSQIKCEYRLWEEAVKNGPYDYYVLLSGTHLPLKPLSEIEGFYEEHDGKNIFMSFSKTGGHQKILKMNRYNLFLRWYGYGPEWRRLLFQKLWWGSILFQEKLGISHNNDIEFYASSNWVSLTQDAVIFLLQNKSRIIKRYRYSFCGDEWFVTTELFYSPYRETIYSNPKYLLCSFGAAHPKTYSMEEYNELKKTDYLFARKFTLVE